MVWSNLSIDDLKDAALVISGNGLVRAPSFNVYGRPLGICGNEPNTITVISYDATGADTDVSFTVAVL